ncbi:MAG: HEAT repeat domain-containing protein [Kofleriaceae bacterium]
MRPVLLVTLASLLASLLASGCANRARRSVSLYEAGDYAGAARAADEGLAAHPGDDGLWQMRIRAALALGDAAGVARAYGAYRDHEGEDDRALLRELAIATLEQALASPSVKMKLVAIAAVESAELHPLADRVAERMGDDDDRVAAAAAIAVLRGYGEAPQVASELLRSDDPEARRIVVDGIGRKVGKLALGDLRRAAEDPDPRVRRAAIRWLGQLGDRESAPLLARALRHSDEAVRATAVAALARLGGADLPAVAVGALGDRALAVRLAGVQTLVAARQTARLVDAASDAEALVALEAAIATGRPELAKQALERAATDEDWTTRAAAANLAIRAVGKQEARALARRLAADPVVGVRLAAARSLASAGERAAAIELFAAALATDAALDAATDLARLDDPRGRSALDAAVRDQGREPDARAAAVAAHATARRVTPGLVAALADPSGVVRVEAAATLVALAKRQ